MAGSRFVVVYPSTDDAAAFRIASKELSTPIGYRSIITTLQTPESGNVESDIVTNPLVHAVFILADVPRKN